MTIIVFLVDNNFSMQQKTYLGISYLDVAKNFIESFIKLRAKEPNARIDRYMLLTLDEYPHNIKAGWRENHITFMHELKFVKANSLSTKVPNAVIQTFDLLNINRFMSGIDTFGQGRSPFYMECCVCIFLTNGCYLQKESNFTEKLINIFNLNSASKDRLLGTELWSLPYRWDHKFFTLYIAYSGNLSNTIMTKMVKSTFKDTTTKVIETHDLQSFCESTGAKLTKVRNPVEMSAFMDWILNYLTLSRITLRFKHPTILIQDVVDIPTPDMSREYNMDFFASSDIDMRKTDFNTKTINNSAKTDSEIYLSTLPYANKGKEHFNKLLGSPVKTYETHITNIIVNAKTNCAQNSYWPLPESFYFHSWEKDILPVRDSIPTLFVNLGGVVKPASYQEAETNSTVYGYFAERERLSPQRTANFPIDRYEIEPSSVFAKTLIEQYKLINDHLTCSTNNENSGKDSQRFDCFQVEMHFTNPKFSNQNTTKSEPTLIDNSNNNNTNALTTLNVPIGYVKVTPIYTILPTLENGEISNTLPPSSYICHLCIGPFNMFALIDIIDEILNVLKCKPTQSWYTRYEAYLNRIPLYYIPALRKALHKIGLQHVLAFPEHLTDGSGLSYPLISYLKKIKSQAKVEYDRQVALISHTLAQSNTGHKNKLENLAPQIIKAPKGCPLASKLTKSLLAQNVDLGTTIPQSSEVSSTTPLMNENNSIGMALTTISLTLTTQSLETYKQIGVQIAKDTFAQFNSPSFLQTMGKSIQPNDSLEMQIICPNVDHAQNLGKRKNGMIFSPYSKCLKRRNNNAENSKSVYPSVINERKTAMYNTIQSLRHLLLVKDTWCRFNFNLPPFNERWVLDTKTFLKTVPPHQEFQVSIAQMGNFQEYQNIKAQQGQTSPSLRPVDPFSINNRGFGLSGPRLHTFGNPFKTVDKKSQVLIDEMIDDTNNEGWANSPSSPNNYNQTQKRSLLASPGMRSPGPLPANYVFIPFKDRIADSKLILVKETFSTTVVKPIITTAYQTTPIISQTTIDLNNNENGTPLNKPLAFKDNSVLAGTDLLNNDQFTQVMDIEISTDNIFSDNTTSENVESYPIPDSPDDDFDEMIHPLTLVIEEPKQHSTQISSPLNANIYNESLVNNKSFTAESFENFSHFYSLLVYVTWPLLKPKWIKRSMKRELLEQTRHLNDSLDKKIEIKQFFHELPSLSQIQFSFSRFPLSHLFCDNNNPNIPSHTETPTNSYDIYQTASVKFYRECYVERAENIVNTDLPDKFKYLTLLNSLQTLDAFKTYNLPQYLNTFQRIELVNPFLALAFSRDHFLFLQHTLHAPEEILTFLTELIKTLCTTFIKDFFVE